MPPMQPNQNRQPQGKQQPQRCPACQNEPMKGSKAGEPICKICGSGLSSSPLGKAAMKQAGDQAAAKVQQAMKQRGAQGRPGMPQDRPGMGQPMPQRPGMGAPQGQPQGQIDPRAAMLLRALAQRGGR